MKVPDRIKSLMPRFGGNGPEMPPELEQLAGDIARAAQQFELFLNLGDGPLRLTHIYRKQQTNYEVHQIRYYFQDDGYGFKIVDLLQNYIVGANGIIVDFGDEVLNACWREHEWNPQFPEETFAEIQRFMVLTMVRDGESLDQIAADAKNFYDVPIDILDLPLSSSLRFGWTTSPTIGYRPIAYSGIDYDSMRHPTRYNFKPDVGGEYSIDADHIIHRFMVKYAGQNRGLSWFLGGIDTMEALNRFEKNVAQAVKNASADPGHYTVPPNLMPSIDPTDVDSQDKATAYLKRMMERSPDSRGILPNTVKFEPSNIGNIFAGTVIDVFRRAALSRLAAHVGLSYNNVSGDFAAANFSSAQQGSMDNRALFRKGQDKVLSAVVRIVNRWLYWKSMDSAAMYRRVQKVKGQIKYLMPPFEYIDRVKAAQADKILLEVGVKSKSQVILADGQEPFSVFKQQVDDEVTLRELYEAEGLTYPGDRVDNTQDKSGTDKDDDSVQELPEDKEDDDDK